jgi:hypothetical protein
MTPDMAAAAVAQLADRVEAAWSTDQQTLHRARELRLSAWAFAVAGRGGVLGDDVDAETVVAALGLIAPEALRAGWEAAGRVGRAAVAVARLAECASWGQRRLSGVVDARLVELLDRVVTDADATAMPIFAATRRLIRTTDVDGDGARVALALHALSEFRSAALLLGSRAVGLEPVELLIAGPEGEQEALTFGWAPPFPSRLSVLRRYALATALADRMMGRALAGLTSADRRDLINRLTVAARAVESA